MKNDIISSAIFGAIMFAFGWLAWGLREGVMLSLMGAACCYGYRRPSGWAVLAGFIVMCIALVGPAHAKTVESPPPTVPTQPIQASAICIEGKLVGIEIEAPFAGTIAVQIPPNVCEQEKPKPRKPNI